MWVVNTPNKHRTLTQCCSAAGPLSAMLAQHQTSTGSTNRVCWAAFNSGWSGSAYHWRRIQADTDPIYVKCSASVASVSIQCWSGDQDGFFMLAGARTHSAWPAAADMKWKCLLISQVCIYTVFWKGCDRQCCRQRNGCICLFHKCAYTVFWKGFDWQKRAK